MSYGERVTAHRPGDIFRTRDLINAALWAPAEHGTARPRTSAVAAAEIVATNRGRKDDQELIAYLAGLTEVTSHVPRERMDGVKRMASLVGHPEHGAKARAVLRGLVAATQSRRSWRAWGPTFALATQALADWARSTSVPAPVAGRRSEDRVTVGPAPVHTGVTTARVWWDGHMVRGLVRAQPGIVAVGGTVLLGIFSITLFAALMLVERAWDGNLPLGPGHTTVIVAGFAICVGFSIRALAIYAREVGVHVLQARTGPRDRHAAIEKIVDSYIASPSGDAEEDLMSADLESRADWRPVHALLLACAGAVSAAIGIACLAVIDWRMSLFGILLLLALCLGNLFYLNSLGPQAERAAALRARIFSMADEARGAEPVDDRSRSQRASEFAAISADLRVAMTNLCRTRARYGSVLGALPAFAALLALGLLWIGRPDLRAAGAMSLVFLFSMLAASVRSTGLALTEIAVGETTAGQAGDLLPAGPAIRFARVSYSFRADEALLRHATFEVPANQLVALNCRGPKAAPLLGALLFLIAGRVRPENGRVVIFGRDIQRDEAPARDVATVPARVAKPISSVREMIVDKRGDISDDWIWNCLRELDFSNLAAELPAGLDTSVRQVSDATAYRLAWVRALVGRPRLLAVHQPPDGLAVSLPRLRAIMSRRGLTVLVLSDRDERLADFDTVLSLEPGGGARTDEATLTTAPDPAEAPPARRNTTETMTGRPRGATRPYPPTVVEKASDAFSLSKLFSLSAAAGLLERVGAVVRRKGSQERSQSDRAETCV